MKILIYYKLPAAMHRASASIVGQKRPLLACGVVSAPLSVASGSSAAAAADDVVAACGAPAATTASLRWLRSCRRVDRTHAARRLENGKRRKLVKILF